MVLAIWISAVAAGESGFSSKMFSPSSQHLTSSCINVTMQENCYIGSLQHTLNYMVQFIELERSTSSKS